MIPNFVDTTRFYPGERVDHSGKSDEFHLVHASNLRPVKRITDIVRVFHLVQQELPARLTILGEGPEKGIAQELIGELGIRERVHFSGASNDMPSVLRRGHLYLLLSDYESFGLSALEAMACGTPAAVSATGGLPEVVTDGETGLLCPVGDFQYTAGKIVRLLREPERWKAMSDLAARRVRKEFTTDRIIPMYEALYENALSKEAI